MWYICHVTTYLRHTLDSIFVIQAWPWILSGNVHSLPPIAKFVLFYVPASVQDHKLLVIEITGIYVWK